MSTSTKSSFLELFCAENIAKNEIDGALNDVCKSTKWFNLVKTFISTSWQWRARFDLVSSCYCCFALKIYTIVSNHNKTKLFIIIHIWHENVVSSGIARQINCLFKSDWHLCTTPNYAYLFICMIVYILNRWENINRKSYLLTFVLVFVGRLRYQFILIK